MKTHAHVKNKAILFGSLIAQERFFEQADGKHIIIALDDAPSAEKRRFFEGCLVPVTFYAHPHSGWESFADAREVLKANFLPYKQIAPVKGLTVQGVHVASTTALSNAKFGYFIEAVVEWLRENCQVPEECFDPDNYKAWRDSAPSPGSIYPPLARLKERYDREKYGAPSNGIQAGKSAE